MTATFGCKNNFIIFVVNSDKIIFELKNCIRAGDISCMQNLFLQHWVFLGIKHFR